MLKKRNPMLKKELRMAGMDDKVEDVIKKALVNSMIISSVFTFLALLIFQREGLPLILLPLVFLVFGKVFFNYGLMGIKGRIGSRRKEIDRDVLFAGRYLLVKLNSGKPLINALIEASGGKGTANKYFKSIVKDIELGKPVEEALAYESEYSPSRKFRKILFQISNALKIGIDVTEFLEATLNDIANDQIIEIQRYGKKLNSLTLFYMLIAVVLPSLGLTIFIIIFSIAQVDIGFVFFAVILFFLALLQAVFLVIYKSIRPDINL